jgi:ParB family transcriptional regulator, chromosome partitioning protein
MGEGGMSRRDRIKDLYTLPTADEKLAMANSADILGDLPPQRVHAGPVRSMGLALDRIEQESRALQDALATGAAIVELDPAAVVPSIVRDRLPDSGAATFEALKLSIQEHGQEVPILVRPHPDHQGQYQIAFGHRRLKAVAALGKKIRAVVRTMTDVELITAQGVENSHREGLSFIERATFAARLEDRGFNRAIICQALATDKSELSKLISVARAVPESVVEAIGPAPKAGRRRWLGFAEILQNVSARRAAEKAAKDPDLADADTDTRFLRVIAATSMPRTVTAFGAWKSVTGLASAKITRTPKVFNIAFDGLVESEFAEFVVSRFDELYTEFQSHDKTTDTHAQPKQE